MMRVTSGKVVARILAGVLAFSLFGQNVTTVYAVAPAIEQEQEQQGIDPEQQEEIVTEPEQKEENAAPKEQEETPDLEDPSDEGTDPEEKGEEGTVPKDGDDSGNDGNVDDPDESGDVDDADEDVTDPDGENTDPVDPDGTTTSSKVEPLAAPTALVSLDEVDDATVATIGDQGYETLQAAIEAANEGDTVTLTKDTTENISINKSITLDLGGKTLSGDGSNSVIKIYYTSRSSDRITVTKGKITGGEAVKGGGVRINGATVTLENLEIYENNADDGGAVEIDADAEVTITSCKIHDNHADDGSGGGVALGGGGKEGIVCTISDSTIEKNTADTGGGLQSGASQYLTYNSTAKFIVNNSKIIGNTAWGGAGVHLVGNGSRFEMSGGEISGNKADKYGGGIYSSNWKGITLTDVAVKSNSAEYGGGIYIQGIGYTQGGNTYNPTSDMRLDLQSGTLVTNNTATSDGGGIYVLGAYGEQSNGVTVTMASTSGIYNNTADAKGDDVFSYQGGAWANNSVSLIAASSMGGDLKLDSPRGEKGDITDWYLDKSGNRWKDGNYDKYTVVANDSSYLALKAAYELSYMVTYDANGGTGSVTDSSKYAEGKEVTVLGGDALTKENNYFIGWNTKADGSGTSYKAGATFTMPGNDVTLYAQWLPWKTTGELPGDMYVDASDSTKVVERQQGTTVDITGQIEVSSIQTRLNTIATALGADSNGKLNGFDIPISISEFGFTATMTLPKGLTLPEKLSKDSVESSIGDFIVTDVSANGQTATVTFGANTDNIKTFAALKALVKSAADQGWISITIPSVKVDEDASVGYLTATGTVTGAFEATAGVTGLNSKEFDFTWEAKQDEPKRDSYTKKADIQATVQVTAATPYTAKNDPPVSKTVTGNPSTAATFTFTLTPDNDSYPLPQKDGKDSTEITITGNGTAEFGDITFKVPGKYTYTVQETKGKAANYKYDTTIYTVAYVVTNNNGKLECTRSIKDTKGTESERCSFTNRYSAPSTPETPSTPADGGGNDGGGDDGGSTTPTTPTTPVQQITEVGNQIADTVQDVIQQITEFGNEGEQVTEITESGDVSTTGDVSATGDDSPMMVYGAVAGTAAIVLAVWFALRKRNHI